MSEDLYWRLHALSKVMESSGRIDEDRDRELKPYAAILDAMNAVRAHPAVKGEPVACSCTSPWAHDQCTNAPGCRVAAKLSKTQPPLKERPDFIAGYDAGLADGRRCAERDAAESAVPIDMILHCPTCGLQHVDAPEFEDDPSMLAVGITHKSFDGWTNPPHRSHLCAGCGHIWRPADVPTNGVAAIKTKGKADSPPVQPPREPLTNERIDDLIAVEWANRNGTTHDALRRIARAVLAAAQEKP